MDHPLRQNIAEDDGTVLSDEAKRELCWSAGWRSEFESSLE